MILFAIAFAYVMIKIVIELMKDQDDKYKIKREQDRQRRELREALRQNARMKQHKEFLCNLTNNTRQKQ